MSRLVQVELPNGDLVWVRADNTGPADVALAGPLKLDADHLRSTVRGVSESLRAALEDLVPDQVQIEFGIELAVKAGKVVSLVAEAGAKATVKLTMTWSDGNAGALIAARGEQPDDEA